jgi:nucleotide-binding universal stress UspA family protein
MGTTELTAYEHGYRAATFGRIVCGVNGSRADAETVRQAAILSGSEGRLEIVCVIDVRGFGPNEQANIAPARAEAALQHARGAARELGVNAHTCTVHGSSPWDSLANMAAGADLLVLGSRGGSRAGGVVLGSVATEAVHRAELPVLIARQAPGAPFPERILLASDGSPSSRAAAALTANIARVHGSEVTLLTAGEETPGARHELAQQTADLAVATGREPLVVISAKPPRTAIAEHALDQHPSLVVLGSSGRMGLRAVASVSEHVAHHVRSSVLVARAPRSEEEQA